MYQVTTLSPALMCWPRSSTSRVAVRRKCSTGRRPPQDLLGRVRDQLGLVAQQLQLLGMLHQRQHAVADRVPRRLVARDHQHAEVVVELVLVEHAFGLRDRERLEHVVGGLGEPQVPLRGRRRRTRRARSGSGTAAAGTPRCRPCRPRRPTGRGPGSRSCCRPTRSACGASSCGTVKIEHRNRIGSSRLISLTKSNSPLGRRVVEHARGRRRGSSPRTCPTPRALNRFEQILRSSVWRGGSVSSIDLRTSSCSSSSSSSETAPSSDE